MMCGKGSVFLCRGYKGKRRFVCRSYEGGRELVGLMAVISK